MPKCEAHMNSEIVILVVGLFSKVDELLVIDVLMYYTVYFNVDPYRHPL